MILIDDIKYACMECVRGHRSSSCKHHERPLLQVRSKGRPGVYANGNPNHRVAIFAEEIAKSDKPSTNGTKRCKSEPIIVLKASSKQVIDCSSGVIIGPYDETKTKPSTVEKRTPLPPIISDESFINTSACCTPKISKGKSCGCCNNKRKAVNKSKILQNYIKNKLNQKINNNETLVFMNKSHTTNNEQKGDHQLYGMMPVPSCSIPGTCCCDDACSCQGCVVHGNSKYQIPLPTLKQQVTDTTNPFENEEKFIFNSMPQTDKSDLFFNTISTSSNVPPADSSSECSCPPNECDCTNCETHGILNGFRLDDYFKDQSKLMNVLDFNFSELLGTIPEQPIPTEFMQPPSENTLLTSLSLENTFIPNQTKELSTQPPILPLDAQNVCNELDQLEPLVPLLQPCEKKAAKWVNNRDTLEDMSDNSVKSCCSKKTK